MHRAGIWGCSPRVVCGAGEREAAIALWTATSAVRHKGQRSPVGAALVSLVASYYGRGSSVMWEWPKNAL